MARAGAVLATALGLTLAAPARAQPAQPLDGATNTPTTARDEALVLFEQSEEQYRAGHFREAADLLERAHAIFAEPVLLYNLARAYEGLGELSKAITTYEKYLAADPAVADRGTIERRLLSLREQQGALGAAEQERPPPVSPSRTAPAATPPSEPAAQRSDDVRSPSLAPWLVAGAGVVVTGAGLTLGLLAQAREDDARAEDDALEAQAEHDEAKDLALASTVAWIAGGVLTGAGVTWGIVDLTAKSSNVRENAALTLRVGFRSASVTSRF